MKTRTICVYKNILNVFHKASRPLRHRHVLPRFWVAEFYPVAELLCFLLGPNVEDADVKLAALKLRDVKEHFVKGKQRSIVRVIGTNNQLFPLHYGY